MILYDHRPQVIPVYMGIDFGGCNAFVSKHFLYSTQVGTALYEVTGKGVAEGVWTDFLCQPDFCRQVFDDNEYHYPGQRCSPSVQEDKVIATRFDFLVYPDFFQINA